MIYQIYQNFIFQGAPKSAQIWIFSMKLNHLATLDTRKEVGSEKRRTYIHTDRQTDRQTDENLVGSFFPDDQLHFVAAAVTSVFRKKREKNGNNFLLE
jgi:hypothetical protein